MPASSLGNSQNFLHSARLVNALLDLTTINTSDIVYEIGPGKGQITSQLIKRCQQVIAIEKDVALYESLKDKFAGCPVSLRQEDFLVYPLPRRGNYKVFSNIPFDQTAAILQKLTETENPAQAVYLILQKEAAARFMGHPHESLRSLLLKPWFELTILHHFRRTDFTPIPSVEAVFLSIQKRQPPLLENAERRLFRDFLTYAYTAWQADLSSALKTIFTHKQMLRLHRLIGKETLRSQLSLEIWLAVFDIFTEGMSPQTMACIAGSEEKLKRQQQKLRKIHRTRSQFNLVRKK